MSHARSYSLNFNMIEINYYYFTALLEIWNWRIICLSQLHILILGTWNKGDTSAIVYIVLLLLDFISLVGVFVGGGGGGLGVFFLCLFIYCVVGWVWGGGGYSVIFNLIYEKVLTIFSIEGLLFLQQKQFRRKRPEQFCWRRYMYLFVYITETILLL